LHTFLFYGSKINILWFFASYFEALKISLLVAFANFAAD